MSLKLEDLAAITYDNEIDNPVLGYTKDFEEAMLNYLQYGFEPGGHFTSLLAGDLFRAVQNCHPAIKHIIADHTNWIIWYAPKECWGSYDAVNAWTTDRNGIRSKYVAMVEKKYVWKTLKN